MQSRCAQACGLHPWQACYWFAYRPLLNLGTSNYLGTTYHPKPPNSLSRVAAPRYSKRTPPWGRAWLKQARQAQPPDTQNLFIRGLQPFCTHNFI
jgi:hypothetical protein